MVLNVDWILGIEEGWGERRKRAEKKFFIVGQKEISRTVSETVCIVSLHSF